MRRPGFEFGIVFGVGVHGRDQRDSLRAGEAVQCGDLLDNFFGSWHIESAGGIEEVDLGVNVEENGFHPACSWRTVSSNSLSAGLSSTRQASSTWNRL